MKKSPKKNSFYNSPVNIFNKIKNPSLRGFTAGLVSAVLFITGAGMISVSILSAPPVITLNQDTPSFTSDPSPSIRITSDQEGVISYTGACLGSENSISSSQVGSVVEIVLLNNSGTAFSDGGPYSGCQITITNTANEATTITLSNFTVDTTAPLIIINDNISGNQVASETVSADITDTNIFSVEYGLIPSAVCNASTFTPIGGYVSGSTLTLSDSLFNGNYLCFRAVDLAGNVTYQNTSNFLNLSQTGPLLEFNNPVSSRPVQTDTVSVNIPNVDATELSYTFVDNTVCNSSSFIGGIPISLSSPQVVVSDQNNNGRFICFRAVNASNEETYLVSPTPMNIDLTSPQVSVGNGNGNNNFGPNHDSQVQGTINVYGSVTDNNGLVGYSIRVLPVGSTDNINTCPALTSTTPSEIYSCGNYVYIENSLNPLEPGFLDQIIANIDTTQFADGDYEIIISGIDEAENLASDSSITVTVDNTNPDTFAVVGYDACSENRSPGSELLTWQESSDPNFSSYEIVWAYDSNNTYADSNPYRNAYLAATITQAQAGDPNFVFPDNFRYNSSNPAEAPYFIDNGDGTISFMNPGPYPIGEGDVYFRVYGIDNSGNRTLIDTPNNQNYIPTEFASSCSNDADNPNNSGDDSNGNININIEINNNYDNTNTNTNTGGDNSNTGGDNTNTGGDNSNSNTNNLNANGENTPLGFGDGGAKFGNNNNNNNNGNNEADSDTNNNTLEGQTSNLNNTVRTGGGAMDGRFFAGVLLVIMGLSLMIAFNLNQRNIVEKKVQL